MIFYDNLCCQRKCISKTKTTVKKFVSRQWTPTVWCCSQYQVCSCWSGRWAYSIINIFGPQCFWYLKWLIPSECRSLSVASGKVLKSFSTWGQVVYETLTNTFLTYCNCFHGQNKWMWCLKFSQIYVLPSGRSACGELLLYAGYLIGLSFVLQIVVPTLHWREYFSDFSVNFGQALVFLTSMVLGTFIQNNHSPSLYLHHQSWYMANTTNVTSIGSWLLRQTLCSRASFECWLQISI